MAPRVIKLGGSLLDCRGLATRFRRWLACQPPQPNIVVVGGGELADVVRRAYAQHRLDQESAHWLCVRLLGVTAELLARLLPEATYATRLDELRSAGTHRLVVFDCEHFLRLDDAALPDPLPHTWDVTSDSIAARLAERLAAFELVLLKSRLPNPSWDLAQAAGAGYVDRYFPRAARCLRRIRYVNLRDDAFAEVLFQNP